MSALTEIVDVQKYAGLLSKALPHVIHTAEENERCTANLKNLIEKLGHRFHESPGLFFSREVGRAGI